MGSSGQLIILISLIPETESVALSPMVSHHIDHFLIKKVKRLGDGTFRFPIHKTQNDARTVGTIESNLLDSYIYTQHILQFNL